MTGYKAMFSLAAKKERGLVVAFLILLGCVWFSYENTSKLIENSRQVSHLHAVHERVQVVLSLITDMETSTRGFVITGDDKYLEPYRKAIADVKQELRGLRELTKDNPPQPPGPLQPAGAPPCRKIGLHGRGP